MKLQTSRIRVFRQVYVLLGDKKSLFIQLMLFKAFELLLLLVTPFFYYLFISNVISDGHMSYLPLVVAGYLGVFVLQTMLIRYTRKTCDTFFTRLKLELRVRILKRYVNMKTADYLQYSTGDLHNRIEQDIELFETFLQKHVINYFFALAGSVIMVVLLFGLNPFLTAIGFATIPISFWFVHIISSKANRVTMEKRKFEGEYESFLVQSFQNWADIKTNNLEAHMTEEFDRYRKTLSRLTVKHQVYNAVNWLFVAFKDYFITRMNLYFVGGLLIIYRGLTVGILLTFMDYFIKLVDNITNIVNSILDFNTQRPNLERVFEILEKEGFSGSSLVRGLSDEIVFSDVWFWYYEGQEPVLRSLNLTIHPGEHLAVAGRSGCGKSTLVSLLTGMYELRRGEILIGGRPISTLTHEDISRKIGIVSQFSRMLNLSVRENLLLADRNADEEKLREVCRRANILSYIESLPGQLDTNIGERGVKLSGGQKQRLAIARLLLQNPDVIIFDESTSALDSSSEHEVLQTIHELASTKTIITIAHRLSTIQICDRVVLMEKGTITAREKPEEMFRNEGFAALFNQRYCETEN